MIIRYLEFYKKVYKPFLIVLSAYIVYSCASMGTPSGGEYDLDPPKVISSNPKFNQLNVTQNRVEIIFDELVQLEKPTEKVIITPPQKKLPIIKAVSNRITVILNDSLLPNTTYTIDFTDAVADYNEKNVLENFAISFSTGSHIDSLMVSGKILSADNLEPVSGIYVGLHSNHADSAFQKIPFDRISRTNERGEFSIKGIAEGEYRVFALNDANRDYMYDSPVEAIAFMPETVKPSSQSAVKNDTIYGIDSLTIDSVKTINYTKFLPDDLILRSFTSDFKRLYLQKSERPASDIISVSFSAPTQMPKLTPLNFDAEGQWSLLEKTAQNDSLVYWITDKAIQNTDTLKFSISYHKTDSLNKLVEVTDTLSFINRNAKREKKDEKEKDIKFLTIDSNMGKTLEVYDTAYIMFEKPIKDISKNKFKLQIQVDSILTEQDFDIKTDSLNPRKYWIVYDFKPGQNYVFTADSAALTSYNDEWTNKIDYKFNVKNIDQYGNLALPISGLEDGEHAFVELLDKSDKPFRSATVNNNEVVFQHLPPGKYWARIIVDRNNNGKWDTGDYEKQLQPEDVYYYNKSFDIKANWDIDLDESWNIKALPLDKQKPLEITKNKPKEKESRKQQLEQEEAKRKQQNQRSNNTSTSTSSGSTNLMNRSF